MADRQTSFGNRSRYPDALIDKLADRTAATKVDFLAAFGRAIDGIQHAKDVERVGDRGAWLSVLDDAIDEIGDFTTERFVEHVRVIGGELLAEIRLLD